MKVQYLAILATSSTLLVSAFPAYAPADRNGGARIRNVILPAPVRIPATLPSTIKPLRHRSERANADGKPRSWRPKFPGDIPPDYDSACEWVKSTDADFETKWEEIRKWHEYFAHTFGGPQEDKARVEAERTVEEERRRQNKDESRDSGANVDVADTPQPSVNNDMGFHNPTWKRGLPENNPKEKPYYPNQYPVSKGLWQPPPNAPPKHWLHETSLYRPLQEVNPNTYEKQKQKN
ncbi:hypothetical protein BJ508DRAFT_321354 [Ascobolus immersus RN42]|uniref:Uncharacterized protein n=1 Tax=Ascobolus immersus RN42 TaxID=1160509 RepID=A0A3N4IM51_ASCIM|nr:hypothetical protein BJ508DRAFT_321354 [Ascobolus immersus RN42]